MEEYFSFEPEDVIQELHTFREVNGASLDYPGDGIPEPILTFHLDLFSGERASIQVNPEFGEAYDVTGGNFPELEYGVATDSASNLASDLVDLAIDFTTGPEL
mgnify:CR=1 FL=1